jgi:hypothetical protein
VALRQATLSRRHARVKVQSTLRPLVINASDLPS